MGGFISLQILRRVGEGGAWQKRGGGVFEEGGGLIPQCTLCTLAKLFSMCLKESSFLDCWKVSLVIPVFKNVGEMSTAKN